MVVALVPDYDEYDHDRDPDQGDGNVIADGIDRVQGTDDADREYSRSCRNLEQSREIRILLAKHQNVDHCQDIAAEPCHADDVDEHVHDVSSTALHADIDGADKHQEEAEDGAPDRNAVLGMHISEALRKLSLACQTVEHTGQCRQLRVRGGEGSQDRDDAHDRRTDEAHGASCTVDMADAGGQKHVEVCILQ